MKPLAELKVYLAETATRCRAMRWLGPLFCVGVTQDIVADVERDQLQIVRNAETAERADLEAAQIIETAAADGLTDSDLPAVRRALKLIRRSASADRQIAEVARG